MIKKIHCYYYFLFTAGTYHATKQLGATRKKDQTRRYIAKNTRLYYFMKKYTNKDLVLLENYNYSRNINLFIKCGKKGISV